MADEPMQWGKLLNTSRFRPTQRVEGELREEFERDYGRTLFSTPVRRLRDKAQVFPLEPHDAVRTRLAHSLEVSSVAESLAGNAARFINVNHDPLTDEQQRSIAWIARTCGLIHDLGNPPFGHAGELAIQTWFNEQLRVDRKFARVFKKLPRQHQDDFLTFEGNAQTLRLACHLQLLTDQFGLNLTFGTLSAMSKYLAASHRVAKNGPHEHKKPGFFASEQDEVDRVRIETGTGVRRNPITYLVEAADDIVYSTVDLEDGVKKKVLDWEEVESNLNTCDLGRTVLATVHDRVDKADIGAAAKRDAYPIVFRTIAISKMVPSVLEVFKKRYTPIMNGEYHEELIADPECAAKELVEISKKKLLRPSLYTDSAILKLEVRGRAVIPESGAFSLAKRGPRGELAAIRGDFGILSLT